LLATIDDVDAISVAKQQIRLCLIEEVVVIISAETAHRWKCGAFSPRPKITIEHSIFEYKH
jgi:hypothetical protein